MKVKIKRLHPDAVIPFKTYDSDFCYDCVAVSEEEIAPNVWKYGLGFALQIQIAEENIEADVWYRYIAHAISARPRSSVWKTGMILSNCIGTVDEGYTGEITAVFYHVMPDMPRYKVGDKICQIHFDACTKIEFQEVDELLPTKRGDKGYGSTGK